VNARVEFAEAEKHTIGFYEAWKRAREAYAWRVDLGNFNNAAKYPGFFDRVIDLEATREFEDAFRASLTPQGHFERAGELVFWKTFGNSPHTRAKAVLARLGAGHWEEFVEAVTAIGSDPSWERFRKLVDASGMKQPFAVPVTFLAFYDPLKFPMADRKIAEWWNRRFSGEPQFKMTGKIIGFHRRSWDAYLAWTDFCRRQAAELTAFGEMHWRARDVEMAVWTDADAKLPLVE